MKKLKKMSMKDMTIRKRLIAGYGILLTLTIIVSVLALVSINTLDGNISKLANGSNKANDAIKMCRIDTNVAARNIREMALNTNTAEYGSYRNTIEESLTDLNEQLTILKDTNVVDETQYSSYVSAITQWSNDANDIMETLISGDRKKGTEMIFSTCVPALSNLVDLSQALSTEIETQVDSALKKSQTIFYTSIVIVSVVALLAIACVILIGKNILNAISTPLKEIEDCAKELSHGNLHAELNYHSEDELGSLAHSIRSSIRTLGTYVDDISNAMDRFAEGDFTVHPSVEWKGDFVHILNSFRMFESHMAETVVGIQRAAEQVENGSQQVSATSMELAEGATEQATVMQQLTSTLNDVSQQISQNANYADEISKGVDKVGGEIWDTNEKMHDMVNSMNEIEESSQKIRQIIDTINDIAEQTNLLALNASIEAARAGEFGRGFAVVASQVTVLANQSAEAAKESTQLIEGSIKEVEKGMALTDSIAKQQESVATNAQHIVDEVENIAKTLKSQDESFTQLNEGIVQINDVIQTNSATSEQCAASSQTMSEQASVLDNLIQNFKVASA